MVGATVSFEAVQSSHYGNLSYQWRRSADGGANFVDIEGAVGSSYRLPSVNLADDGAMFMVVARTSDTLATQAMARLSVSATPPRVYQDGDFDLAGWTVLPWTPPGTPAATPTVERMTSGGNPDAFLKTSLTMPSGTGSVTLLYLSNSAVHDPAVDGAIRSLDYGEDCVALLRGTRDGGATEAAGRAERPPLPFARGLCRLFFVDLEAGRQPQWVARSAIHATRWSGLLGR
jgi:hypothetical protein